MKPTVLILDSRSANRRMLALELRNHECVALECSSLEEAWRAVSRAHAVCLGELSSDCMSSIEALKQIRAAKGSLPVILWLPDRTESMLLQALRDGAVDYFKRSDAIAEIAARIGVALERQSPISSPASGKPPELSRFVGESAAVCELRKSIPRLAASDCNVLITGETGTGKDLAAELIHHHSRRHRGPMVCLNCAALPDSLIESELFGYERGAFTGAAVAHRGKLESGNGGTVFLDEIGEMTPFAQSKILRVLETRQLQRLGSNTVIPIDIRVIAATNQDLGAMVAEKTFRSDLFFRLSVARVHLPPLRERKEDIPGLLSHYLGDFVQRTQNHVPGWTEAAVASLVEYDWPGNIRELKNLLEAIFIDPPSGPIGTADLPGWFSPYLKRHVVLPACDRQRLIAALSDSRWNKSRAAAELKWSRMTLYRKMRKYGIASAQEGSQAFSSMA